MSNNKQARIGVAQVNALKPDELLRDTEIKGFGARRRDGARATFYKPV